MSDPIASDPLPQALETITALNKNIAEETLAQIEVGHGLFCKVLTPLQACSAYVGESAQRSCAWVLPNRSCCVHQILLRHGLTVTKSALSQSHSD